MALVRYDRISLLFGATLTFFFLTLIFKCTPTEYLGEAFLGWIVLVNSAYLAHVAYQLTLLIPS